MRGLIRLPLMLLTLAGLTGCDGSGAEGSPPVVVRLFVAASAAHVVEPLAERYRQATGITVRCNTAASSTLARQIERGAPADLYLSASPQWMDHLADAGLIRPGSRRDLLGNRLVLITSAGNTSSAGDLADALSGFDGRLAMGDPGHVPAGMYAEAALERLSLWDTLAPRIVPAKNARAALLLVERGEADLGVVYATDAASSDRATVVAAFPEQTHAPIRYPAALTIGADAAAHGLLDYLQSADARRAFQAAGFTVIGGHGDGR